jgi:hypothetical protein
MRWSVMSGFQASAFKRGVWCALGVLLCMDGVVV